jgi:hypothetical protein
MPRSLGYIAGPLVIPQVAEFKLRWHFPSGRTGTNVMHVSNPTGIAVNPSLCDAILAGINADARITDYKTVLSTNSDLNGIAMRNLDVPLASEFTDTIGGFPGTSGFTSLPSGVALVVTLKSATSGRTGRGRVYLGGFTDVVADAAGRATTDAVAFATGFVQAVSDAIFANGMALTIANRAHDAYISPATGLEVPAAAAGHHDVVSITVEDDVFDSQRRRKG